MTSIRRKIIKTYSTYSSKNYSTFLLEESYKLSINLIEIN